MADFNTNDAIVTTECGHVFHQVCCEEWLKQARTCPVCRTDIPDSLGMGEDEEEITPNSSGGFEDALLFTRGPFRSAEFQRDLVNLVSLIRETNSQRR